MIVEVVAVGTELLLGQIVNTNAAVIGAALAEHGHDAHFQQVVGDNMGRLTAALRTAIDRSDVVIITGGIGPTQDDLTRDALAEATERKLLFSDEYADELRLWWEKRGREMPQSNLRQAEYPEGAEMLPNPRGTAPGLLLETHGTLVFCIPGVPAEMEFLLHNEVLPRVKQRAPEDSALVSRLIRTWGRSESAVAEILADLYAASANPTVAFLASGGEIKVRLTAKAATAAEANAMLDPLDAVVRERLGDSVFGVDDETIERVLFDLFTKRGWTVGVAESMTGGMLSGRLTDLAGASEHFIGAIVPYHPRLKTELLGVADVSHIVNHETARAMADGARRVLGSDVGVSITGSAGPDPLEEPPGTVYLAVATPEETRTRRLTLVGDRERVRAYAATAALHLTRLALEGRWWRS